MPLAFFTFLVKCWTDENKPNPPKQSQKNHKAISLKDFRVKFTRLNQKTRPIEAWLFLSEFPFKIFRDFTLGFKK